MFFTVLEPEINMRGSFSVRWFHQDVLWGELGLLYPCAGGSVSRSVRQEAGIVWQQAIKQTFPLYLYSRHGYWASSSDGSSSPCHIYISLFFVHLPLFSFSQTASFFSRGLFCFCSENDFLPSFTSGPPEAGGRCVWQSAV